MSDVTKNASMEQHKASQEGLGIGKLVTGEQHRDAIHVAIVPMTAAETLRAGEHIGVFDAGMVASRAGDWIGVVDPFLRVPVQKGERFWLFLYPGSITSLRHVWTHPALGDEANMPASNKSASEVWMRAWAKEHMSEDYYGGGEKINDDVAYDIAIRAGHDMSVGPYEEARDSIDDEWWAHWEAITGGKGQRGEYFSCAC